VQIINSKLEIFLIYYEHKCHNKLLCGGCKIKAMCDFTLSQNLYSSFPHLPPIQDSIWLISYPLSYVVDQNILQSRTLKEEKREEEKNKVKEEGKQN
jgi:hypothetical protein